MQPSNILKIESLADGWCDKDFVLLHACFQLLTDFIQKEMLPMDKYLDWNENEETKKGRKEIEELDAWWREWKKSDRGHKTTSSDEDRADYLKENEMLKRLIDVRMYLWT